RRLQVGLKIKGENMLDPQRLHGVIPPVITPLTADSRLDVAGFEKVLEFLITEGVHGLFVLGSTSEFAALTQADRYQTMDTAVREASGHRRGRSSRDVLSRHEPVGDYLPLPGRQTRGRSVNCRL